MKRLAFLVLVFSAAVFAEDKDSLEYEYKLVKTCLHKAHMTGEEIGIAQDQLKKMSDDNIDEKTKKILEKHGYFAACVEEDEGTMKDSKLVVDKIMEAVERNMDQYPVNKDFVKECVNALNNDSEMTREDRATGMAICMVVGNRNRDKKK